MAPQGPELAASALEDPQPGDTDNIVISNIVQSCGTNMLAANVKENIKLEIWNNEYFELHDLLQYNIKSEQKIQLVNGGIIISDRRKQSYRALDKIETW